MLVYDGADLLMSRLICCFKCRNVVALQDDLVSKDFTSGTGRAYLFSHVWNVTEGPRMDRRLLTGVHNVADVHCCACNEYLGWTYAKAYTPQNKYKEGKTVLVKNKIINKQPDDDGGCFPSLTS